MARRRCAESAGILPDDRGQRVERAQHQIQPGIGVIGPGVDLGGFPPRGRLDFRRLGPGIGDRDTGVALASARICRPAARSPSAVRSAATVSRSERIRPTVAASVASGRLSRSRPTWRIAMP